MADFTTKNFKQYIAELLQDTPLAEDEVIIRKEDGTLARVKVEDIPGYSGAPLPNAILYGGNVSWTGTGLVFSVGITYWRIGGKEFYTLIDITIELSPADATYGRFDLFAVNDQGGIVVIEGTPAENPVVPSYDPDTQLPLTSVLVAANATEPDVATGVVFNEGAVEEWTPGQSGATASWAATANPFKGSIHGRIETLSHGDYIEFTPPSAFDTSEEEVFVFGIQLLYRMTETENLYLVFEGDAGGKQPEQLQVKLDKNTIDRYQLISFSLPSLNSLPGSVTKIKLRYSAKGTTDPHPGFDIDYVNFQKGVTPPTPEQEHNSLPGLQGGDSGKDEYFHLPKPNHDAAKHITKGEDELPKWKGEEWPASGNIDGGALIPQNYLPEQKIDGGSL